MRLSLAFVALAGLFLGGCAIHPLPEDVTRHSTKLIVDKIKCEAREALDNITVGLLRETNDPVILGYADQIEAGTLTAVQLFGDQKYRRDLQRVPGGIQSLFANYTLSAVTFDFDFAISETNDNSADANFRLPLIDGLFTIGANAGARFDRNAHRKFQTINSFEELHSQSRLRCESIAAPAGNLIYPITGKIGIEEVFRTFVAIDSSVGRTAKFSDQLIFTTTINAGVTPRVRLDPIADRRFRLADAGGSITARRDDQHGVTLSLARTKKLDLFAIVASPRAAAAARLSAKQESLDIANSRRLEDIIIVPRQGRPITITR